MRHVHMAQTPPCLWQRLCGPGVLASVLCVCVYWGVHQVRARYARARGLERLLQEDDPARDVAEDVEPTV